MFRDYKSELNKYKKMTIDFPRDNSVISSKTKSNWSFFISDFITWFLDDGWVQGFGNFILNKVERKIKTINNICLYGYASSMSESIYLVVSDLEQTKGKTLRISNHSNGYDVDKIIWLFEYNNCAEIIDEIIKFIIITLKEFNR